MDSIIKVNNLSISFGLKNIVNNISFELYESKITCLVGQSGSGKSLTALALINMLSLEATLKGEVIFQGLNLIEISAKEIREIRGKRIFSIYQNPMNSFNPSIKLGKQFKLYALSHGVKDLKTFNEEIINTLYKLNFTKPEDIFNQYPFQLSGGMLQRLMICLALVLKPDYIIADEPTTALDVTVQKEILRELRYTANEYGIGILMITHDFGVVAEIADEVLVMNKGEIVEKGSVLNIFNKPKHSYTKALLKANLEREVS